MKFYSKNGHHIIGQVWHKYEGDQQANLVVMRDSGGQAYVLMNVIQCYDGGNHPDGISHFPVIYNDMPVFSGTVYQVKGENSFGDYAQGESIEQIKSGCPPHLFVDVGIGKI